MDSPGNSILNNTWYYCVGVANITGGTKSIYINGVLAGSVTSTGWGTDAGNASIGGETAGGETGNRINGRLDEVRVANTALTAGWIQTEYNNQNSPSTFYAISAEPKVWNGGTDINDNTASNWLNNSAPGFEEDVIVNNGTFQPTLQGSRQLHSVFIRTGAVVSLSSHSLAVRSDITNCGTIAGNTGIVVLNSATQTQTQHLSGSGTYSLTTLVVNNTFATNPAVRLNKDVNVYGALALGSGIVYTSATNILALGTAATSGAGSATSFVSGPMSKDGTASFIFPVGKGTRWRRIRISNTSGGSGVFRAEYFNTAFTSTTPVTAPLDNVSTVEYWQLDRLSGSTNANVSLYWENAGTSGIDNCADLTIARWSGTAWDERAAVFVAGSTCSGTGVGSIATTGAVTAFSPFTFGSKSSTLNPLPIELVEFRADCNSEEIKLNWSTATETNNDHFVLERSFDTEVWTDIAHIKGAGTSRERKDYSFSEHLVSDKVVYYKLTQVDKDGRNETFKIIETSCSSSNERMLVYPNPASNELNFKFELSRNYGVGTIKILDNLGRVCLIHSLDLLKGSNGYNIQLNLPAGPYSVLFTSEHLVFPAQKLIVR